VIISVRNIFFSVFFFSNKYFLVALQISVAWQARLHVRSSSRYLALIATEMCRNIFAANPIPKISIMSTSKRPDDSSVEPKHVALNVF